MSSKGFTVNTVDGFDGFQLRSDQYRIRPVVVPTVFQPTERRHPRATYILRKFTAASIVPRFQGCKRCIKRLNEVEFATCEQLVCNETNAKSLSREYYLVLCCGWCLATWYSTCCHNHVTAVTLKRYGNPLPKNFQSCGRDI